MDGGETQAQRDRKREPDGHSKRHVQRPQPHIDDAASDGSRGIHLLAQHHGYAPSQYIAHHASGNPCQEPHQHRHYAGGLQLQRPMGADYREQSQAEGISHRQEDTGKTMDVVKADDRQADRDQDHPQVGRVGNPEYRAYAEYQVAQGAAANAGDCRQYQHAEGIHA